MKIACGTDIIKIERIKNAIEKHKEKFLNTVFTEDEIEYCSMAKKKYQHYAARFAAKEATFKAMTKIFEDKNVDWQNIEVLNFSNGRPKLNIKGKKFERIQSIDLSISHSDEFAIATVVILYE